MGPVRLDGWHAVGVLSSSGDKSYRVLVSPWPGYSENVCECRAYEYRGHCRHQEEAQMAVDEQSKTEGLAETTARLGTEYKTWKSAEKAKNEAKDDFFAQATAAASEDLAQQVVEFIAPCEAVTQALVEDVTAKKHPGWVLIEWRQAPGIDGVIEAIIEEDPAFKPFTFLNEEDGQVYSRQIATGAPLLDDEALQADDPDLWLAITEEKRVLKPLDTLPDEQLAAVQKYIYFGKPTVKLAAPKKAKKEDG